MKKLIISCDWGSTSFRLRLVNRVSQAVITEVTNDEGIIYTFNKYQSSAVKEKTPRKAFFLDQLKRHLIHLSNKSGIDLSGLDILLSGMASASIGMYELPYADLPFATDGSQARIEVFEAEKSLPNRIILISGVKNENDVMRGEETQLIGLIKLLEFDARTEAIFILPGTHSKHLHVRNGSVANIQTFMTGELYNILTHHSILKDSVDLNFPYNLTGSDEESFITGVCNSKSANILNSLFGVRTNQLFGKFSKGQNALYLSGLLIGNESNTLVSAAGVPLILCSGGALHKLYHLAFESLGLLDRTNVVSADMINKATIAGQVVIAQNNTAI